MNQNNVPSYYQQQIPGQQPLINMNIPMNQSPQIMNQQQQQQNFPQIQPTNVSGSSQISNGQFKSIDINFSNANVENKQIDPSLIVSFQNEFISDEIQDPVTKCKDLFPVLKSSIQNLIVQLSTILNPSNEPTKTLNENQFITFGKNVENFNKICDLLNVNLRAGCESQMMANDLRQFYRYYSHIDGQDSQRTDSQMINSMNIQTQRVHDLKAVLNKFLE